jgi:hypothetical protein
MLLFSNSHLYSTSSVFGLSNERLTNTSIHSDVLLLTATFDVTIGTVTDDH